MDKLKRAKTTLVYYFQLASRGEWRWNGDSRTEIEGLVDEIVDTAVKQAVAQMQGRIEALESMIRTAVEPTEAKLAEYRTDACHINQLESKTAAQIDQTLLQDDTYHQAIATAAKRLVELGRGDSCYAGQYSSGTTLWLDADNESFLFNDDIVTE